MINDGEVFKPALFDAHVFSESEKEDVINNNAIIDLCMGHKDILEFLNYKFKNLSAIKRIDDLTEDEKKDLIEHKKKKSLLMTSLFLSGKCDANCDICYTDSKFRKDKNKWESIESIIRQVVQLGNKTLYVPGEGEPFLDDNIFNLINAAEYYNQNLVLFTNGIILSDEEMFENKWGISLNEFFEVIQKSPIYLYFKYWHSDRNIFADMMRINPDKLKTESITLNGSIKVDVPIGLLKLHKIAPEKVGIETAVHSLNYNNVFDRIMPFADKYKLKWYLEPIIHSGRCYGRKEYDITQEQMLKINPYLSKQQCKRAGYTAIITTLFYISFCSSFISKFMIKDRDILDNLSVFDKNNRVKDIFSILHTNRLLVESRYSSQSCLCEYYSNQLNVESNGEKRINEG